jgi:hypothetical protein
MEVGAAYSDTQTHGEDDPSGPSWETGTIYDLLVCPACRAVSLRSYFWHDAMDSEAEIKPTILYPSSARMPLGLPPTIEKAYIAALRVRPIDSNAFGVLIGRVIDLVCADRSAQGKFLSQKLADLAKKGEIPEKLVGVSTSLTKLRNVGAHAELGELTEEEVPIVDALCRALLDYLYTAPFLAQRAEDRVAQLKQRTSTDAAIEA